MASFRFFEDKHAAFRKIREIPYHTFIRCRYFEKLIKRVMEETQNGGKGQCDRLKSIGCQLPTTKLFCAACVKICTVCAACAVSVQICVVCDQSCAACDVCIFCAVPLVPRFMPFVLFVPLCIYVQLCAVCAICAICVQFCAVCAGTKNVPSINFSMRRGRVAPFLSRFWCLPILG